MCERVLKRAILHRKNALFYRTEAGAMVGDLLTSLIVTCGLNQANPFHSLTELHHYAAELEPARPLAALELPRLVDSNLGRPGPTDPRARHESRANHGRHRLRPTMACLPERHESLAP